MSLPFPIQPFKNVLLTGTFFYALLFLGCREKAETPDWSSSPSSSGTSPASELSPSSAESAKNTPSSRETPPPSFPQAGIRFLSYNVENYLTMRRGHRDRPKSEQEISALVDIIVAQQPDILGICEIGTLDDLANLQERLARRGLDLTHTEHCGGADPTRRLALLSRFPIIATNSQSLLHYQLDGRTRLINRGILDATVKVQSTHLRLLGVHLKSKREVRSTSQELIRQNEARLLRLHCEAILSKAPATPLLIYGDFNDTIGSETLAIIRGDRRHSHYLQDVLLKDSRGELWTHFWDYQDVYSRFDYVLFSKILKPFINLQKSHIIDHPQWSQASDHRALLLVLE